jgi:N-acetylmuramoyl-L-alanine amidase
VRAAARLVDPQGAPSASVRGGSMASLLAARSPEPPSAALARGARGAAVEEVQTLLAAQGSDLEIDGSFGPATAAAVTAFQQSEGLEATGVVDPETLGHLRAASKPDVVSAPSPNHSARAGVKIDTVILHHTASDDVDGDLQRLQDPKSRVSAHYLIAPDGTIRQLVDDADKAWHAGEAGMPGQPESDVNARSIGIEITNDGLGRTPFTDAQYAALDRLVPYLARSYGIPAAHILGHRDVARPPGRKIDPADNFDWSRVRTAVSLAGIV